MGEIVGKSRGSLACFVKKNHYMLMEKLKGERTDDKRKRKKNCWSEFLKRIREGDLVYK